MIDRVMLERACRVVEQLQLWIDNHEGLSIIPQANLECSSGGLGTMRVRIGDVIVWDFRTFGEEYLTLSSCRDVWLEEVFALQPFMLDALLSLEPGDDQ